MRTTIYEKLTPILEKRGLDVVKIQGLLRLKIRDKSAMVNRNVHFRGFYTWGELRDFLYQTQIITIGNRIF